MYFSKDEQVFSVFLRASLSKLFSINVRPTLVVLHLTIHSITIIIQEIAVAILHEFKKCIAKYEICRVRTQKYCILTY